MTNLIRQAAAQPFVRLYIGTTRFRRRVIRVLARLYRLCLGRVTYIGTTGSFGKSTTTTLIHAVLEPHGRVKASRSDHYCTQRVIAGYLLAMHPLTRFCVLEVSGARPNQVAGITRILRPDIGVVTHVSYDHYRTFHDIEKIANGKADLVRSLPPDGYAVLNSDDSRVAAMAACTRARVITVGLSETAMWRAENISSVWPERLSFDLVHEGTRRRISTRLNGEHWVYPVLFAVAVGRIAGVSVDDAIEAVSHVDNISGRMDAVETADGVTYIDDSWKSPYRSVPASVSWLKQARAPRKIAVLGTISDYPGAGSPKYRDIARQALEAAQTVLFVGKQSNLAKKAAPEDDPSRLQLFETTFEARQFLRSYVREDDLVLVKGSGRADHFERLVLDYESPVTCWRHGCGESMTCRDCPRRHDSVLPDGAGTHSCTPDTNAAAVGV